MTNAKMLTTVESSWAERARRGGTILSSFGLQALLTSLLLILPLLRQVGMPSLPPLSTPISLGQPLEGPAVRPHPVRAFLRVGLRNSFSVAHHLSPLAGARSMLVRR